MGSYMENALCHWSEDSKRIMATPSLAAKTSFYYVQEVGHFRTGPRYFTERKNLNSFLVVYTLSGKGRLTYKEETYSLQSHQVFFIDCMEYQLYRTDERELWVIAWVHFNGSESQGYFDQYIKNGSPVVSFNPESGIPDVIHKLIQLHLKKDIRTEPMSSMLIVQLLTELWLAANLDHPARTAIPEPLQNITKYLETRFDENISLDQLAQKFATSKFYLIKSFKKHIGLTPIDYLIHCRISFAKQQLKYTNHTVSEIARQSVVENVTHFINLFKEREGMTPLAFRKQW